MKSSGVTICAGRLIPRILENNPVHLESSPFPKEDMPKDEDEYIRMRGTVLKMLPDSTFEVKLDSGFELLAKPSGRMRRGRGIRVLPGDVVDVEVSTYDPTRGRIVWRYR